MSAYNYTESVNPNLTCCICRMPFTDPTTTRTCSHTFCCECIVKAVGISAQCPIDRSPLGLDDLMSADPIVRSLVDELVVECPNQSSGCSYTCQRQLVTFHTENYCQYAEVTCSEDGCDRILLRKDAGNHAESCIHHVVECDGCGESFKPGDLQAHNTECTALQTVCTHCSLDMLRSDLVTHYNSCPELPIPCSHSENGCPWIGARFMLQASHLPSCPYESIKGFFALNTVRMSTLSEENTLLRHKVETLEGLVQTLRREINAVKSALGPWFRPDGPNVAPQPGDTIWAHGISTPHHVDYNLTPISPPSTSSETFLPAGSVTLGPDVLASYFPPEDTSVRTRADSQSRLTNQMGRSQLHNTQPSDSNINVYPRISPPTPVAPLNLSTTLEGSLVGLRESVVSLSTAMDSFARRGDIALTNETLRLNEEMMSLRANIHGLRMQVHAIMMDRNAQVTGRSNDSFPGDWVPPIRLFNGPQIVTTPGHSITKL